MKKNIGIWIDTKQATIIRLSKNNEHFIKKIKSNIETRVRVPGESKKYGRFGGQYITYEKNRENKKNEQINLFFKELFKEIENCDALVIFGPAKMKKLLENQIRNNMQFSRKLLGVHNSELLTENQIIAWVKDYYNN